MNKFVLIVFLCSSFAFSDSIIDVIDSHCESCPEKMQVSTGAYILEHGEESLLSRAWLVDHAKQTIDVQYFIWSTDNIGILASEALLRAAERGVKVRVIVDDFLIDAENKTLVALNAHPNVEIKIYNPKHSVGTSDIKRILNIATNFRGVNQRMHDKTAIFDNAVGITGGRNMADEYYDYDRKYNFRDRDIVLMGAAVNDMTINFNEFWDAPIAVSVDKLLKAKKNKISQQDIDDHFKMLHDYAQQESNFEAGVKRRIEAFSDYFPNLAEAMIWDDVRFISDKPGKNNNKIFLSGGSETTTILTEQLMNAKNSVIIQSPYLIVPDDGIEIFENLVKKGVVVKIVTNSLASTDNMMAFSGYHKQRKRLLKAGIDIYEFKPHPAIEQELNDRYPRLKEQNPVFAIHAKSMVIDKKTIYIGTFNLDPRSANLNTEVGVLINNLELANQLQSSIERDIKPENSWRITKSFNPDDQVSVYKRFKLNAMKLLPMKNVL